MSDSASAEKDMSRKPSKDDSLDTPNDAGDNSTAEKEQEGDDHVYSADNLSSFRQFLMIGTVCMAMFTNQLGLGNTLGIVGVIGETFGLENEGEEAWLVAGYSLTVGTFILLAGRLGDLYGYKRMFLIGMTWYAIWSLAAGVSVFNKSAKSGYVLFIFARAFQGIGPSMTMPAALALLGTAYRPGQTKNMAFALFGGCAPFGAVAGFLFGGLFALAWWPWTYYSQAIALAALTAFATWSIPDQPLGKDAQAMSATEKVKNLDLIGGTIGITALVLINFAWNQAVVAGWEQPYVYATLIVGCFLLAVFAYYEARLSPNPLLPFAAFNGDIAFVFGCTAAGWGTFGIWVFYAAQLVIYGRGVTPLLLSAWYSPVIPSGLISALAVGKLLGRKLSAAWVMVIGQVAFVVGSLLIATYPVQDTYWGHFFFSVLIITVGMDSSFPAATIIFSDAVEPKYQGMAASVVLTIVNYSISLALGFAGTVEIETKAGDAMRGYRNALWFAVGLAGLGLVLSLIFVVKDELSKRRSKQA